MENNATMGLLLFLVVVAFPVLAVIVPFFNVWYARNRDEVHARVAEVQHTIEELKVKRDAAYQEDEQEANIE